MSFRGFLTLVVAAVLIALVAALHSPFPEKLSASWADMSRGGPSLGCPMGQLLPSPLANSPCARRRSSECGTRTLQLGS